MSEGWSQSLLPQQATPYNQTYFHKPETEFVGAYNIGDSFPPPPPPPSLQQHHFNSPILYYNNSPAETTPTVDYLSSSLQLPNGTSPLENTPIYQTNTIGPHTNPRSYTDNPHSHTDLHSHAHSYTTDPHSHATDPHSYTNTATTDSHSHTTPQSPMSLGNASHNISPLDSPPDPSLAEYLDKYINGDHTHSLLNFPLDSPLDKSCETPPITGKRHHEELNLQIKIPRMTTSTCPSSPNQDRPSSLPIKTEIYSTNPHSQTTNPHSHTTNPHSYTSTKRSGHLSDTSSGISSSSAKFSTSSSSPSSSPCLVTSPFSYPNVVNVRKRITPVYEPHSGLGSSQEYMKGDPFMPPSPPSPSPKMDLHPELPVYEVHGIYMY